MMIAAAVGNKIAAGIGEEQAAREAIMELAKKNSWNDDYASNAYDFAELLQTEKGRQSVLQVKSIIEPRPFVKEEESPSEYSIDRLKNSVETKVLQPGITDIARSKLVDRLEAGDEVIIEMLTEEQKNLDERLRNLENLTFYSPSEILGINAAKDKKKTLPFQTLSDQLWQRIKNAGITDYQEAGKRRSQALYTAFASYYGLKSAQKKDWQKYEKQLSNAMMREGEQRRIVAKALVTLISRWPEVVPGLAARFQQEINYLDPFLNGEANGEA